MTAIEATAEQRYVATRKGHWRALEQLELPDGYVRTRSMYSAALAGVEVYLRLTDSGFTVLSLDSVNCATMIGVGRRRQTDSSIYELPPRPELVTAAAAGYAEKRDTLAPGTEEERHALELVCGALSDRLGVARPGTSFIAQEWRLPSGARVDLLCVDLVQRRLVVVVLKASERAARAVETSAKGDAWSQARTYSAELHQYGAELYPFFERMLRALARHHGAPDALQQLSLDVSRAPAVCVSWPGGGFRDSA